MYYARYVLCMIHTRIITQIWKHASKKRAKVPLRHTFRNECLNVYGLGNDADLHETRVPRKERKWLLTS
jgi:hypothetical protein